MPMTPKVEQDIQFLSNLDATQFSVSRQNGALTQVTKRTALSNFLSWVIYLITFTLVPRNRELDGITRAILKEIENEIKNFTQQEQSLAEKSIKNLKVVIANNGGSEGEAIEKLLKTISKIQALLAVQKLSPKKEHAAAAPLEEQQEAEEPPAAPETRQSSKTDQLKPDVVPLKPDVDQPPKADEPPADPKTPQSPQAHQLKPNVVLPPKADATKLQVLLQDLLREKAYDLAVLKALQECLPTVDDSVTLSDDELATLARGLSLDHSCYKLATSLLSALVKNSFQNANLVCLIPILQAVDDSAYPVVAYKKEQLTAIAKGFLASYLPTAGTKQFKPEQLDFLVSAIVFGDKLRQTLKDNLTVAELKEFLETLFDIVVTQTDESQAITVTTFKRTFLLFDNFGDDYREAILEKLCRVKSVQLLAYTMTWSDATSHNATKTILNNHPFSPPDDPFFQELIGHVKERGGLAQLIGFVVKHETILRNRILIAALSPTELAQYLVPIPTLFLADLLDDQTMLAVANEVERNQRKNPNDLELAALAKAITGERLYAFVNKGLEALCASLLPLCDVSVQVQFVSKVLDSRSPNHERCLEKVQLKGTVWEEASKQNPSRNFNTGIYAYSPKVVAHIVNGQIGNKKFLREFFNHFFGDMNKSHEQKTCMLHLKPEVFNFDHPDQIKRPVWYQFFKILRELPDQDVAKQLLTRASAYLFNEPDFGIVLTDCLYALKKEQLALLPIDHYRNPEIRLLLACLTDRLDDTRIKDANELQGIFFFHFFEPAFKRYGDASDATREERYGFAFKTDIAYLKNFLLWILDRQDISPLLPAWKWLSDNHAPVLSTKEIQDDPVIQGHIKRLGL